MTEFTLDVQVLPSVGGDEMLKAQEAMPPLALIMSVIQPTYFATLVKMPGAC